MVSYREMFGGGPSIMSSTITTHAMTGMRKRTCMSTGAGAR